MQNFIHTVAWQYSIQFYFALQQISWAKEDIEGTAIIKCFKCQCPKMSEMTPRTDKIIKKIDFRKFYP